MGVFSSQISTKTLVPLCRQLATADQAGIPIVRTLELVGSQFKDKRVREVLAEIQGQIQRGSTLADAARSQSKYLPRFFVELLATGEKGGRLDISLRELADYYEDRLSIQRQAISMLTLPALEVVAAWFLGSFALMLINRVLGQFQAGNSQRFDFGTFLRDYGIFQGQALLVAAVIFAGCVVLSRMGLLKWVWGFIATHVWPVAGVTRRFAFARFYRSLSLLLGAGINVIKSVESSAAVMANPYLERDMLQAIPLLKSGRTMYEAFAPSKYMAPVDRERIFVGETSGSLEASLQQAATANLEQASHSSRRLVTVFTMLIALGAMFTIGAFIIMFYARLYGGMMDGLGI